MSNAVFRMDHINRGDLCIVILDRGGATVRLTDSVKLLNFPAQHKMDGNTGLMKTRIEIAKSTAPLEWLVIPLESG